MKEIKFRAWDKEMKQMIYQGDDDYDFILTENGLEVFDKNTDIIVDCEIMPSVIRRDKNKNNVFEGDILKSSYQDELYVAKIMERGIYHVLLHVLDNQRGVILNNVYTVGRISDCEVIGNIHEHSHLLKENEKC